MNDDFDERQFRPAEYLPDTEVTLGPMVLASLGIGLLLVCGFCFGLGYMMGSRGARASLAASQKPPAPAIAPAAGLQPKPAAGPQIVKPALPAGSAAPLPAPASGQPAPAFGTTPSGAWMVQIATLSQQADANTLVGALRRRGYAPTVRLDPADNMFHVQVGPFGSPNDANAARQKLLNDGYNAVVQP